MTDEFVHDGLEERSEFGRDERSSSRPDGAVDAVGPPRRVLTDGGQAEMEASEDETADSDDEPESEEAEGEGEEEPEGAEDSEAEEGTEEETEESETKEETAEEPGEPEAKGETAEETEEPEAKEEAAEGDESHVEDAEDVYQGDEASGVLHLDLDGLFLDLLGLEVNLNPVTLDVSARPGGNNLLGNLLSAVTGLLDGSSAMLDTVTSLLDKPKEWLSKLLGKPKEWLSRLFGGAGEEAEAEEGEPAEAEGAEPSEEDEAPGRISRAVSWLKEKLSGLVPSFPTEEIVAMIVSQVIEQLVERLEPERTDATDEQAEPSQAEATS